MYYTSGILNCLYYKNHCLKSIICALGNYSYMKVKEGKRERGNEFLAIEYLILLFTFVNLSVAETS